jgi:hypothetical protein
MFGTYQAMSTIMHMAFKWECSRISLLEVEAACQSCILWVQIGLSIVLYMTSSLLVERFDLGPSSQSISVKMIPSFFPFYKNIIVPGKSPLKV